MIAINRYFPCSYMNFLHSPLLTYHSTYMYIEEGDLSLIFAHDYYCKYARISCYTVWVSIPLMLQRLCYSLNQTLHQVSWRKNKQIIHSHTNTVALNVIGLILCGEVRLTNLTYWSITMKDSFYPIPNWQQKITHVHYYTENKILFKSKGLIWSFLWERSTHRHSPCKNIN